MVLTLYSSLTRKEETLNKKKGSKVGLYSCGPTVYHYAHIGNMRSFVFADLLGRTLRYAGYDVRHVMNITDVGHLTETTGEDKIERQAKQESKSAEEIAAFYTEAFVKDLLALNVDTRHITFPRASSHIEEQIALIKRLHEKGFAYQTSDGVYFDTAKDLKYGALAHLNKEELFAGSRVERNEEKRSPADFALWKFSPPGEARLQEWESPWGVGFPGWHIECSAMAMKYLGEHFDIHTGGNDLIFPHHTNEIAQSENATGDTFVDIWMHSGFVNISGEKMAKSEGNFLTLGDVEKQGFSPLAYRYFLLSAHYRKPIEWSEEAMTGAQNALEKLHARFLDLGEKEGHTDKTLAEKFRAALAADLNTPAALAIVWETLESTHSHADKRATLLDFDQVLGLGLGLLKVAVIPHEIEALAQEREMARKGGNFSRADTLRQVIEEKGYTVKDTSHGPKISPK